MNDPMLAVDALDRIVGATRDPDQLTMKEASGLYAAARFLQADLDEYIDERGGHAYASEKLFKALWHIGAILGFDITNGHDASAHRSWAMGQIDTLRGLMREIVAKDPDR